MNLSVKQNNFISLHLLTHIIDTLCVTAAKNPREAEGKMHLG